MNIKEVANRLGFDVRNNRTNCFNKQAHKNGDSNPSLVLYENSYKCMACGIEGNKAELVKQILNLDYPASMKWLGEDKSESIRVTKKSYNTPEINLERPNEPALRYLEQRFIPEEWSKKFRISYIDNSVVFPYFKNGKLVNAKYRGISEKKFRQEKNAMPCLWLQDYIKSDKLIICEGEIDAMSLWEYGFESVSIPSGVSNLEWIENDWDFLERFAEIFILMDNDEAGQSAVGELVKRLGNWRCKNVILPKKDANECLINGITSNEIQDCLDNATDYNMSEIKTVSNYSYKMIDYLTNPQRLEGITTSNYELTKILKGWRNKELTIWSGQNGSGKSTYLSQEVEHFVSSGKKVLIGSFEMPPEMYLMWLGSQYFDRRLFAEDIPKFEKAMQNNLFIIDVIGNIEKNNLLEIMEFAYKKYGIDIFIIDSLMKVNLTTNKDQLYGEQKNFVSELKDFAMNYDSQVHLVAHARKGSNDESEMGKTDVSGSSDITNLADNVIILHRYLNNIKKSGALFVRKNRLFGTLGNINLNYLDDSKKFVTTNEDNNFEL